MPGFVYFEKKKKSKDLLRHKVFLKGYRRWNSGRIIKAFQFGFRSIPENSIISVPLNLKADILLTLAAVAKSTKRPSTLIQIFYTVFAKLK